MKQVEKGGEPHEYSQWRRNVKGSGNEHFGELRNPFKEAVRLSLLQEQGFICAYTMKRIGLRSSHIEHVKPQSLCRKDEQGSDLNYDNFVACFPRESMTEKYKYGAPKKADWWENNGKEFISPLQNGCEEYFVFQSNGKVLPRNDDEKARNTIEVLDLNHDTLVEERHDFVDSFINGKGKQLPLSPAKARNAIEDIFSLDKKGRLKPFCVALLHGLHRYLEIYEKRARKRQFSRKSRSGKNKNK